MTEAPEFEIAGKKKKRPYFFMVLAVYLGHGILHPVITDLIFPLISFWERSLSFQNEG